MAESSRLSDQAKEYHKKTTEMARAKESRDGHNKKQLVVKEVVRSDQMPLMHGQLASLSTAADDWNDDDKRLRIIESSARLPLSQSDSGKSRVTKPPDDWNDTEAKPRWLDEQTQMSRTEYLSYYTVITKERRDMFDHRVFLPHQAPNCGMSTTFGDLCDFLCEPLKHAHAVRDKRRGLVGSAELRELVGSAELPIGLKLKLWAANKEQDALLKEMDITLLHLYNCAAMNTVYDLLSTAWKMRLQKNAERRERDMRQPGDPRSQYLQ